jgi:hypothetical protein
MARFYISTEGRNGGAIHRTGVHGVSAHLRGWEVGAAVDVEIDKDGHDVVRIYRTGGSRGTSNRTLIAELRADDATPYGKALY